MGRRDIGKGDRLRDRAEMDVPRFADVYNVHGHGGGGDMGSEPGNIDLKKCSDCGGADTSPPKDCFGRALPYGYGLVGCSIRGVGYYPFQYNACLDHHKKV